MESWNCSVCLQVNVAPGHKEKPPGIQLKGTLPFEHLEADFTEMKPCRHYRYLPVMVRTFSGWLEAFPTWIEKAKKVAQCLLWELVPRFGFPTGTGSDNSRAFVADLIQQVCKALKSSGNYIRRIGPRVPEWWKKPTKLLRRHFQNGS